jgi:hypothetical protein
LQYESKPRRRCSVGQAICLERGRPHPRACPICPRTRSAAPSGISDMPPDGADRAPEPIGQAKRAIRGVKGHVDPTTARRMHRHQAGAARSRSEDTRADGDRTRQAPFPIQNASRYSRRRRLSWQLHNWASLGFKRHPSTNHESFRVCRKVSEVLDRLGVSRFARGIHALAQPILFALHD